MADVVVVANDLLRSGTTGSVRAVEFGEAITAGQMLYQDGTDQKYYLAVATDPTKPANTGQLAISLTTAAADQTGVVARTDTQIDFGATAPLTQGEVYVLSSANAGGIAPVGPSNRVDTNDTRLRYLDRDFTTRAERDRSCESLTLTTGLR